MPSSWPPFLRGCDELSVVSPLPLTPDPAIGDGEPPILSECPRSDLDAWWQLTAFILTPVNHCDNPLHHLTVESQSYDLAETLILFDIGFKNRV